MFLCRDAFALCFCFCIDWRSSLCTGLCTGFWLLNVTRYGRVCAVSFRVIQSYSSFVKKCSFISNDNSTNEDIVRFCFS